MTSLNVDGTNVENGTLYDDTSTVQAGQWLTITGYGHKAGAAVTVKFGNVGENTVIADSHGMITDRIQVPVGDAAGTYVITATGMSADGALRVDSTLITVAEPGGGTPPAPPGGGGGGGSGGGGQH